MSGLPTFNPDANEWCVGRGCDFDWNRHVAGRMSAGPTPYFGLSASDTSVPYLVSVWLNVPGSSWSQMDESMRQGLLTQARQMQAGYDQSRSRALAALNAKVIEHSQLGAALPSLLDAARLALDAWLGTLEECAGDATTEIARFKKSLESLFSEIGARVKRANDVLTEYNELLLEWEDQDPFRYATPIEDDVRKFADDDYLEQPLNALHQSYVRTQRDARAAYVACARRLNRPCSASAPCGAGYSCVNGRCQGLWTAEATPVELPPLPPLELVSTGDKPPWLLIGAATVAAAVGVFLLWQGVRP